MISPDRFRTRSLLESVHGSQICRILSAAMHAVDPYRVVQAGVQRDGDSIIIQDFKADLKRYRHVYAIGIGKACAPMLRAIKDGLGDRITAGIGITKNGYVTQQEIGHFKQQGIEIYEAGHPIPDERGIQATREVIHLLKKSGENDLIIVVLSGGGSALLTAPVPSISLEDLQILNTSLIKSGADIQQINTIRKHIDDIKGGGLACIAYPANVVTLILSDVVGDALDFIASGPTVADRSTFHDAQAILRNIPKDYPVPGSILQHIEAGAAGKIPENPEPGAAIFDKVNNVLVGSNRVAAQAAIEQAQRERYHTLLLTTYLQGEARWCGSWMGALAQEIAASGQPLPRPACIVAGGETTVTVHGDGMGGRNLEMALGAVEKLSGLENVFLITLATDGGDGNSDAAGAVVSGSSWQRAKSLGLDAADYLRRNDSYHFFKALGDLVQPGATQTNVNDLTFLFACEREQGVQ